MKMKLKGQILTVVMAMVFLTGIVLFWFSSDKMAEGIYDQAYSGMYACTLAVSDIFENSDSGKYRLSMYGEMWKGGSLNISKSTDIVDRIKENTGYDVTIFWGDTQMLTSIMDENGERQIGTQAPEDVVKKVLEEGQIYQNKNVYIQNEKYIVCYMPLKQNSGEIIGMIFLGIPQDVVIERINNMGLQILIIVVLAVLVVGVLMYFIVNGITVKLNQNMDVLAKISEGNLAAQVDSSVLARKDEIGDLGRAVTILSTKLRGLVEGIHEKSEYLNQEVRYIEKASGELNHNMRVINGSTEEIAGSCSEQAGDANKASGNVHSMGQMISENGQEVTRLSEISGRMKDVSENAMEQFAKLKEVMAQVKEAINFLLQQTTMTGESVAKIGSVTELISDIASQTNLLSLNASIEAARAGEHGRGFAVVAAEIQELSNRSNQAAEEIRKMVGSLNENSSLTLDRVDSVQDIIEKQEEDIRYASEAFEGVRDGIGRTMEGIIQIRDKSEKMERLRSDTVDIVESSAELAEKNSAIVQETTASISRISESIEEIAEKTRDLSRLSEELRESVSVFNMA